MLLTEYLKDFTEIINEYSKSGLIISSELKIDERAAKIGLLKAVIIFIDDSKLFITEYLDLRYKIEKLAFSYHYQGKNNELIFRYDNAAHRPSLNFQNHKHINEITIIEAIIPNLDVVLEEIINKILLS